MGDGRTLNEYGFGCGEVLNEMKVYVIMESVTGEKLERKLVSSDHIQGGKCSMLTSNLTSEPENAQYLGAVAAAKHDCSKYVREDNRPECAKYLGYLGARDLYPDLKSRIFEPFVEDLMEGKVKRPYSGLGLRLTSLKLWVCAPRISYILPSSRSLGFNSVVPLEHSLCVSQLASKQLSCNQKNASSASGNTST